MPKDPATLPLQQYLGSIARQLLSHYYIHSLPIPEQVNCILETSLHKGASYQCSIDEAEHVISSFAQEAIVYIVVDALDECQMNI